MWTGLMLHNLNNTLAGANFKTPVLTETLAKGILTVTLMWTVQMRHCSSRISAGIRFSMYVLGAIHVHGVYIHNV
jgi:hypothetical protein